MMGTKKLKRIYLSIIIFGLFSIPTNAQQVFQALDSLTRAPIEGALVQIMDGDKAVTGQDGCVKLFLTPKFPNYARASHSFYKAVVLELKENRPDTLKFFLAENIDTLAAVSITATGKQVKMDARGATLALDKIPQAKSWTLKDALEQIPGVRVDEKGGVTYMGDPIMFKENGQRSPSLNSDLTTALRQPAAQYRQIELQLYDPKERSNMPVLNLTKPREDDLWGRASGSFSNSMQSVNAGGGWQNAQHRLELFAGYSVDNAPTRNSTGNMNIPSSSITQFQSSTSESKRESFSFSGHYNLSLAKHTFDVSFFYKPSAINSSSAGLLDEYHGQDLYRTTLTKNQTNADDNAYNLIFGYIYAINKLSKLYLTINVDNSRNERGAELQTDVTGAPLAVENYKKNNNSDETDFFSALSYELKHPKVGMFEAGAKYFRRNRDVNMDFLPINNGIAGFKEQVSYKNSYDYAALFASWNKTIRKTSFYFVLKGDYSVDKIPTYGNARFEFFTFSPYLSIARTFGVHSLRLIGEYFETRPDLHDLNPIAEPGVNEANRIISVGNPNLEPSKTMRLTATYATTLCKKVEINTNFRYALSRDKISEYRTLDDTLFIRTFENMASSEDYYGNFFLRYPITSKLTANFNVAGTFANYLLQEGDAYTQSVSWNSELKFAYQFNERWNAYIAGGYDKFSMYQYETDGRWKTSAGISYTYKSLWMNLGFQNFHRPKETYSYTTETNDYIQTIATTGYQPFLISFSISYKFGKEKAARERAKSIKIDDM